MQMCFWTAPRLLKDVLTPFGSRYQDKAVSNMVLWKTAECDRAHPPTPTTPFIPSTCNGAPAFSCTYLAIMHKVLSFGSLMGTQYITHVYGHISSCRSRAHHLFLCHRGVGLLLFSPSPLGICSTSFSSGVGQRPLFCNCASLFIWLNVASAAILAGLLVTSAINPHTSVNKLITSWGQKSPLVSHHHHIETALCGFQREGNKERWS